MSNRVFIIGDTHFGHKNIIRYCNRPFKDVYEMNKVLVQNWNSTVGKDDIVYMLGDFALTTKDETIEIGHYLNGNKTLILGNHDHASMDTYRMAGFKYVSNQPIIINDFFILSHTPQYVEPDGLYANIFGHIHNNPAYKDFSTRTFCASVERINYTPIDFEEIIAKMEGAENVYKI